MPSPEEAGTTACRVTEVWGPNADQVDESQASPMASPAKRLEPGGAGPEDGIRNMNVITISG